MEPYGALLGNMMEFDEFHADMKPWIRSVLQFHGKTIDQFNADVRAAFAEYDEYLRMEQEHLRTTDRDAQSLKPQDAPHNPDSNL